MILLYLHKEDMVAKHSVEKQETNSSQRFFFVKSTLYLKHCFHEIFLKKLLYYERDAQCVEIAEILSRTFFAKSS